MVIIATFAMMDEKELEDYKPTVVQVDAQNRIVNKEGALV
jgi:aspartate 1-decarboxylase